MFVYQIIYTYIYKYRYKYVYQKIYYCIYMFNNTQEYTSNTSSFVEVVEAYSYYFEVMYIQSIYNYMMIVVLLLMVVVHFEQVVLMDHNHINETYSLVVEVQHILDSS
eukprot:GHVR01028320.1.p1 GENE.GHVR01028320.1~~GHVR01028320.1.p1  ORF type:complete len:108 (-),score=7.40 GHVR01028320.1:58-381(-)